MSGGQHHGHVGWRRAGETGTVGNKVGEAVRDHSRKIRKNKQTNETAVHPRKDLGVYPQQDEKSWRDWSGGNDLIRSTFYKDCLGFDPWEEKADTREQLRGSHSGPDPKSRPDFLSWLLPPSSSGSLASALVGALAASQNSDHLNTALSPDSSLPPHRSLPPASWILTLSCLKLFASHYTQDKIPTPKGSLRAPFRSYGTGSSHPVTVQSR